jgi:hypothetical protein
MIDRLYVEYHGDVELDRLDNLLGEFDYRRTREGHFNALYEHAGSSTNSHVGASVEA